MNNPLFKAYAQVVERFFVHNRTGDAISVFPDADLKSKPADAGAPASPGHAPSDPDAPEHLSQWINQHELKVTQDVVDHFRRTLVQERGHARLHNTPTPAGPKPGGDTPATPANLTEGFSRFQAAVKTGDESGLQANPFYELTKLVFNHTLGGVKNLFEATHLDLVANPPEKVQLLRTFREIWFGRSRHVHAEQPSIPKKISDQMDAWMGMGKIIVAILLFIGSSFTTGRGVNDLLQSHDVSVFFGGLFDGRAAEGIRYTIALTIALMLSSAILDYKDHIFRAICEEGRVMQGIRNAFLRSPCWMILATFLAFVSIKTNYDGIVSIISKKADLAKQSEEIRARVKRALGSAFFVNTVEPGDLYDLQGLMHTSTAESLEKFLRVPDDEVSGVASSGDPRKGPRYWGKYFIVNGGYEPGVRDVVRVYQRSAFSRRIDAMLQDSGVDLRLSLSDKIAAMRTRYDDHLRQTQAEVDAHLKALNGLMEMRGYSLGEIKRVFALEHYQINDIVLAMAEALEKNKEEYERVAAELNALTDTYVALLQQVDKSGAATRREYHIEGKLEIPDIDAIKELRNTQIPKATHKSFAELKAFLILEYGLALANGLLFAILFVSVCMDLLDPLIYSRWMATIGKQDKRMFPDLMEYLREWENDFVIGCHQFFYRRDVQQVFRGLAFPNRTGVRSAFYLMLERIDPYLKDPKDQTFVQRSLDWFFGLFRLTRTTDMRGYNQRAAAIAIFVHEKETWFPLFLEYLFSGLTMGKGLGNDPFLLVMKKTETAQAQHREMFAWELQIVAGKTSELAVSDLPVGGSWDEQKELSSTLTALENKRKRLTKHKETSSTALPGKSRPGAPSALGADEASPQTDAVMGPFASPAVSIPAELLKTRLRPDPGMSPFLRPFFKENSPAYHRWIKVWHCALIPPVLAFPHTRRRWLREIAKQDGNSFENLEGLYDFMPDLKETLLVTLPKLHAESLEPLEAIRKRFPDRCASANMISLEELQAQFAVIEKESLQILGLSPAMGDQTRLYAPVCGIELELEGVSRDVLNHVGGDSVGFNEKIASLVRLANKMLEKATDIEEKAVEEMTSILREVKRLHEGTKQILLKINMSGSESRKAKLPPRDLLRLLRQNKDVLEQAPKQSETILRTMEQIFNAKEPYTEASFEVLKKLYGDSQQVFNEVRSILVVIQGADAVPALGTPGALPDMTLAPDAQEETSALAQHAASTQTRQDTQPSGRTSPLSGDPDVAGADEDPEQTWEPGADPSDDPSAETVPDSPAHEPSAGMQEPPVEEPMDPEHADLEETEREEDPSAQDGPLSEEEEEEKEKKQAASKQKRKLAKPRTSRRPASPFRTESAVAEKTPKNAWSFEDEEEGQEEDEEEEKTSPKEVSQEEVSQEEDAPEGDAPEGDAPEEDAQPYVEEESAEDSDVAPSEEDAFPEDEEEDSPEASPFDQKEAPPSHENDWDQEIPSSTLDTTSGFASMEAPEDALINLASFSQTPPEGGAPGVVPPAATRADRFRKFSALQWGKPPEMLNEEGFFSGVVSSLSDQPPPQKTSSPQEAPATPEQPEAAVPPKPEQEKTEPPPQPEPEKTPPQPAPAREEPEPAIEFKTKDGLRVRGMPKNVSLNGFTFRSGMDLSSLQPHEKGQIKLASPTGTHQFDCEVVRVAGEDITLKVFAWKHSFEKPVKERMFEELHQDHHALKQEHPTTSAPGGGPKGVGQRKPG